MAGFTPLGLAIPMRDSPEGCLVALVQAMVPAALTVLADVTAKTLDPEDPAGRETTLIRVRPPKLLRTMMRAVDFLNSYEEPQHL